MSGNPDELDDGLEYAYESDNVSGGEEVPEETLSADQEKKQGNPKDEVKKSQDDTDDENDDEDGQNDNGKKRKRKSDKLVNKKKQKMEYDVEQKRKISTESSERITDFIASKIRARNPDLSALELSELYIPKNVIKYTGFWTKERNLTNLPEFIKDNFEKMIPSAPQNGGKNKKNKHKKKAGKDDNPQPQEQDRKFILILSMSALRVCDIHRATKDIAFSSVKLIKKNKLKDELELLKKTKSRILAATPQRIVKILNEENSTIKLREIKTIIIDSTYLDQKKNTIWDMDDLIPYLRELTKEGAKVHLY